MFTAQVSHYENLTALHKLISNQIKQKFPAKSCGGRANFLKLLWGRGWLLKITWHQECYLLFKFALSGPRQSFVIESTLKMMKNAFYFTSKALFVLKIFKFLSCIGASISWKLVLMLLQDFFASARPQREHTQKFFSEVQYIICTN